MEFSIPKLFKSYSGSKKNSPGNAGPFKKILTAVKNNYIMSNAFTKEVVTKGRRSVNHSQ
jgi:hypothetical protein